MPNQLSHPGAPANTFLWPWLFFLGHWKEDSWRCRAERERERERDRDRDRNRERQRVPKVVETVID